MKRIYALSLFTFFGLALNAQTLTEANHSPLAGDLFTNVQCDSTGVTPGASGTGITWNFSSVIAHTAIVNNFTAAPTSTINPYPVPGIAVASSINNISYYTSSPAFLKYWGGNIIAGPVGGNLIFSMPAISAVYPMSINSTSSSVTGGTINVSTPLSLNGTFTGNSGVLADATGTIILPFGTFNNVIRVVTTQTIIFTTALANGTITQMNYDYYSTTVKPALFTISTSTLNVPTFGAPSTQTVVTRFVPSTVGINETGKLINDLQVYPNPSTTNVNFVTKHEEAKSIMVYDVTGNLIVAQDFNEGKLKLDVSNFSTGLYIYNIIGSENKSLKSGKISVCH